MQCDKFAALMVHTLGQAMLQVHGFPKVMGVLTHLDGFKDNKQLKKTKKALKHRFWTEIYQGVAGCGGSVGGVESGDGRGRGVSWL